MYNSIANSNVVVNETDNSIPAWTNWLAVLLKSFLNYLLWDERDFQFIH
jgi:hypothetical protein